MRNAQGSNALALRVFFTELRLDNIRHLCEIQEDVLRLPRKGSPAA
ncbi:MAG: hypothetical protein ACNA71_00325 [Kiritimatiellia bacterium]